MKAPFEVGWSEFSSMRLWRFSGSVLNQHTLPKFSEIGGSDGTRIRGLCRDRAAVLGFSMTYKCVEAA
jgi:hypothetical protein